MDEQAKAMKLARDICEITKLEIDPNIRMAALKGCLAVEESIIQSEATKEVLRQTMANLGGEMIHNS